MNKFDALKQFQSWPDDWQAICVEYLCVEEGIMLPSPTQDEPKAAPKVAVRTRKSEKHFWSAAESEFLLKLISEETESSRIVERFIERYRGRSAMAVRRRVWGIRTGEIPAEVQY